MSDPSSTTAKSVSTSKRSPRRTWSGGASCTNRPAVVALVILAVLFVGCYALPPLLPYSYTDLDYYSPQGHHLALVRHQHLGRICSRADPARHAESVLIRTVRGAISRSIAAVVGAVALISAAGAFRADVVVDLLLVVPSFC